MRCTPTTIDIPAPVTGQDTFSDKIQRLLPIFNSPSETQSVYSFLPEYTLSPSRLNLSHIFAMSIITKDVSGPFIDIDRVIT
jgi:hypothetical protein